MTSSKLFLRQSWLAIGLVSASALLSGCGGLSGLGATSEFKCTAPVGIPCQSVSAVYLGDRMAGATTATPTATSTAQAGATEPRSAGPAVASASSLEDRATGGGTDRALTAAVSPAMYKPAAAREPRALGAIRSDPTVIRIWVAPWEDADGDLNDQGYVYLQIDSGRWLIEHNRERIRREFSPQAAGPVAQSVAGPFPVGSAPAAPTSVAAMGGTGSGTGLVPDGTAQRSDDLAAVIAKGMAMARKQDLKQQAQPKGAAAASVDAEGKAVTP
jgi:conjugal transfer pilus assembly protein TraV